MSLAVKFPNWPHDPVADPRALQAHALVGAALHPSTHRRECGRRVIVRAAFWNGHSHCYSTVAHDPLTPEALLVATRMAMDAWRAVWSNQKPVFVGYAVV